MIEFKKIDDAIVILYKNGSYSEHTVWHRRNQVYAKMRTGFVKLARDRTSRSDVMLIDYDLGTDEIYFYNTLGHIVLKGHKDKKEPCNPIKNKKYSKK